MPSTYTPISTTTTTGATSIDFTSISSTYTDLIIVAVGNENAGGGGYIKVTVNNNTGAIYSRCALRGNGTAASSASANSETAWYPDFATNPSNCTMYFMNYSNTTTFKTMFNKSVQMTSTITAQANLWRNTSAINRITLASSAGGATLVGTFTLYGIKAA
jgi:hypothetical protein